MWKKKKSKDKGKKLINTRTGQMNEGGGQKAGGQGLWGNIPEVQPTQRCFSS